MHSPAEVETLCRIPTHGVSRLPSSEPARFDDRRRKATRRSLVSTFRGRRMINNAPIQGAGGIE
jgi:hypothetical protein